MTTSAHHPAGTGTPVGPGLDLRMPAAATAGAISVHEGVLAPGDEIDMHVHESADQLLYVIEGEIDVNVGGDTFAARDGDLIAKPHGIMHGFANRSERPARVLEITAGDSFERLTLAAATMDDPSEFPRLRTEHGVHSVAV